MGIMIGMFSILPIIDIQAAFGMIILCASGYFAVDADIDGFATLLVMFWCTRDIHLIIQYLLLHFPDNGVYRRTHPPWTDLAPYLPGGCYGYAMSQYHVKKKSGHSRPKKGGPAQPITSRATTYWLARTSFSSTLMHMILFCFTNAMMRTNGFSEIHSHVLDEMDTTDGNATTDGDAEINEDDMTKNWEMLILHECSSYRLFHSTEISHSICPLIYDGKLTSIPSYIRHATK